MFIVQVVGSVKAMEPGEDMADEIKKEIEKLLDDRFGRFGSWEIFVKEQKTRISID